MKRILLGGIVLLAACSGGDGPTDSGPTVVSVTVTSPSGTSLTVGGTLQANATPIGTNGEAVPGKTVTWSSTNAAVATVSQTGLITGVSVGTATIRATVDNRSGSLNVVVDENRCTSPLTMTVGEVRTLSGPAAVACITLAATSTASEFLFISANGNSAQDDLRAYQVTANVGTSAATASTALAADAVTSPAMVAEQEALAVRDEFETKLRMAERQLLEKHDLSALASAARKASASRSSTSISTAQLAPGDTVPLRVTDANSSNLCTTFAEIRAVVKHEAGRVALLQDVAAPANGFSDADFAAIASEFNSLIYPVDESYFGTPTDVNGDGRIIILYTPEVNKLTPSGSTGFVGGFFFGADLFPRSIPAQNYTCNASNEREIFYVLAPDPTGAINGNVRSTATVRQNTRGTIAHELQHMINQGVRMLNPAVTQLETPWLNEAMSHFAEEAVGRSIRGFTDFQSLNFAAISANTDDFNAFFRQNLLRFRSWMQRPDTASPISRKAASQLAPRGAGWALVRYVADHHSNNNVRAFFRGLAGGPGIDVPNLVSKANGANFEDIISGWLVANYADELPITGLNARNTYRSWEMRSVMSGVNNNTYPLLVTALPTNTNTQSLSGSGNYFRLSRGANTQSTFRMLSSAGGNVDFQTARVYVLRVN